MLTLHAEMAETTPETACRAVSRLLNSSLNVYIFGETARERPQEVLLDHIVTRLLDHMANPSEYFRHFRFTVFGIRQYDRHSPLAIVGLPETNKRGKKGVLMVGKIRMERIEADAYGVVEFAPDSQGRERIFFYLTAKQPDGSLQYSTKIYVIGQDANNKEILAPLDPDDWILSDPRLIAPDPDYQKLFIDLPADKRAIAEKLDGHSVLQRAPEYLALDKSTFTLMALH